MEDGNNEERKGSHCSQGGTVTFETKDAGEGKVSFRSVGSLGSVVGMTMEEFQRSKPHPIGVHPVKEIVGDREYTISVMVNLPPQAVLKLKEELNEVRRTLTQVTKESKYWERMAKEYERKLFPDRSDDKRDGGSFVGNVSDE